MSDKDWTDLHCMSVNDPYRLKTADELLNWVNEIGFLPLFRNEIDGFSVEEHTALKYWWSGVEEYDPWQWREQLARTGKVAYGKFFNGKSGFVSTEWFPELVNYRRDGYDFDARWEDGLADQRSKKIMDCFELKDEYIGLHLKRQAGFGKRAGAPGEQGEKNFNGIVTLLQMQTYLVIRDFRYKVNKRGEPYGMPVSVYVKPEVLWGYDQVSSAYKNAPEDSRDKIFSQIRKLYPDASEKSILKVMR